VAWKIPPICEESVADTKKPACWGWRPAAIMSLIQLARMNRHDTYAYLKDVLTRLPTQRASEIDPLLPHRWMSA